MRTLTSAQGNRFRASVVGGTSTTGRISFVRSGSQRGKEKARRIKRSLDGIKCG